mgnify:FL=1
MSKALITGSFDPITLGHLDIIERSAKIFDEVTVLISKNASKESFLCSKSRAALALDAVKHLGNVKVDICDGLVTTYAAKNGIDVIVRGLRNSADFEYENNMSFANRRLSENLYSKPCETIFMPAAKQYSDVSSSLVRLMIKECCDVSELVPNSELLKSFLQ